MAISDVDLRYEIVVLDADEKLLEGIGFGTVEQPFTSLETMGKKIKRKTRCGQKDKSTTTTNPKTVPKEQHLVLEQVTEVPSTVKERKECAHLDKSMDLTKVSSKLELAEGFRCDDCREGSMDRKAAKKRGKQKKNKGTASKAIWVCLECGHFGCGGVGLPTISESHAVWHYKQTRHPLVIQVEKSQLRWCFPCSKLISMDRFENDEQKDVLFTVVKLFKQKSSVVSAVDVEDVWFGSGSILSELKSGSSLSTDICRRDFYAVRGLSNLGNTCFFNSVLQNLLAMGRFQDDLLKLGDTTGPLTNSLKKLYVEINAESGVRSILNPKSLFGCVCSKAPQFRGYQQQDSHELLRYLLDGLSTEELRVKKLTNSCPNKVDPSHINTSFVDTIFGGQLSSTVCCVECGHSSTVYEPYLDLSLPVPTKKPPPRKVQTVSRNRKTKPPPKKNQTVSRNRKTKPVQGKPASESSQGPLPSAVTVEEKRDSVNSSSLVCPTECGDMIDDNDSLMQRDGISALVESKSTNNFSNVAQHAVCLDDTTWMDFAEPLSLEDEQDLALISKELSANQDSGRTDVMQNDVTHQDVSMGCDEALLQQGKDFPDATREIPEDGFAWMDFLEPVSVAEQAWAVQPDKLAANQDSERTDLSMSYGIHQDLDKGSNEVLSHNEELNVKSHSYLNSYEDEVPLQVGDSQVLLLPYTEESVPLHNFEERDIEPSSSAVVDADDMLGFDGFADMFNEPEVTMGPHPKPSTDAGEEIENGVLAGNSSESNPDEVDDTDSPVSIESCLSHFTKPELLADEHAWHCENCTKLLLKQRKKKLQPVLPTQNGYDDNFLSIGVGHTNGNNGIADSDRELQDLDRKQIRHMGEEEDHRLTNGFSCASETSAVFQTTNRADMTDNNVSNSSEESTEHATAQATGEASESAGGGESGESDEEEADSKGVKAMRNATKRILINKLPSILTIHLKRFNQDTRGRLSKLNGHVVFKEVVDLRPYMDSRCPEKQGECKYRLIGLVEHLGSMRGGHYVAYVRGGERRRGEESEGQNTHKSVWYYASDAHVHETTLEEVLRCEAYILFYEKV
ncbi:hypothetical protein V2J09_013901 [Rumex salicifolius]